MAFEWLSTEDAARTLSVDQATLQQWIDSGHAPSRSQNGRVEVLIEFDEDDADPDAPADDRAASPTVDAEPEPDHADDTAGEPGPTLHELQVVHQRELQMAGGMVAAWQRLAESADQELRRTRRIGMIGWAATGVLLIAMLIGVGWAVTAVERSRSDLALTQTELTRTEGDLDAARTESADRRAEIQRISESIDTLRGELAVSTAELARSRQAADDAAAHAQLLETQNADARRLAERTAESHSAEIARLQQTHDRELDRNDRLQQELAALRQRLDEAIAEKRRLDSAADETSETADGTADAATPPDSADPVSSTTRDDEPREPDAAAVATDIAEAAPAEQGATAITDKQPIP